MINGEREALVNSNEYAYVSAGKKYRLGNAGFIDVVMIEVLNYERFGKYDSLRFEARLTWWVNLFSALLHYMASHWWYRTVPMESRRDAIGNGLRAAELFA
jgi:hypothetical protein